MVKFVRRTQNVTQISPFSTLDLFRTQQSDDSIN